MEKIKKYAKPLIVVLVVIALAVCAKVTRYKYLNLNPAGQGLVLRVDRWTDEVEKYNYESGSWTKHEHTPLDDYKELLGK